MTNGFRVLVVVVIAVMVACTGLMVANPGSFMIAQLTGTVLPVGVLLLGTGNLRRERKAQRGWIPQVLRGAVCLRCSTPKDDAVSALCPRCKERELGLPTATAPPVTAREPFPDVPGYHICNGKRYACYCPVHGQTEASRPAPAEQLAQLSQEYGLPVVTPVKSGGFVPSLASLPGISTAEFTAGMAALQEQLMLPEKPYVPAGQAELSANLLEYMVVQVKEAAPSRQGHSVPYPGDWQMNEEWSAEVKKLRRKDGRLLWNPEGYTVFGYTVTSGDGPPELVPSPSAGTKSGPTLDL